MLQIQRDVPADPHRRLRKFGVWWNWTGALFVGFFLAYVWVTSRHGTGEHRLIASLFSLSLIPIVGFFLWAGWALNKKGRLGVLVPSLLLLLLGLWAIVGRFVQNGWEPQLYSHPDWMWLLGVYSLATVLVEWRSIRLSLFPSAPEKWIDRVLTCQTEGTPFSLPRATEREGRRLARTQFFLGVVLFGDGLVRFGLLVGDKYSLAPPVWYQLYLGLFPVFCACTVFLAAYGLWKGSWWKIVPGVLVVGYWSIVHGLNSIPESIYWLRIGSYDQIHWPFISIILAAFLIEVWTIVFLLKWYLAEKATA